VAVRAEGMAAAEPVPGDILTADESDWRRHRASLAQRKAVP